ncbi:MAG: PEP/pyruvate-binding domain-containing protein [Anaerolineales bacterium]
MVIMLRDLTPDQEQLAGGKGGALARLLRRGFPVPDGFVILSTAFSGDEIKPESWEKARARLARLRRGAKDAAFAVRSSCGGEDSAQASYAGEFETVLDVRTDEEIRAAIGAVRRSRNARRVEAYNDARGLAPAQEMAVVVQRLVRAEYSGVLFTADPVSGSLMQMTGNGVRGMGDRLVSGAVNPMAFTFDRPRGGYLGPAEFKPFTSALYRLAERLDRECGSSQDIEWAEAGGRVFILQARPITTMREFNPVTGEVNATCTGDFLWSNGNAAEIQPEVMTPLTRSVSRMWGEGYSRWWSRYPVQGNIGGRSYFNISVQVAPFANLPGVGLKTAMRFVGDWWGRIPETVTVPLMPFTVGEILFRVIPLFLDGSRQSARNRKRIPGFVRDNPAWCRGQREQIRRIDSRGELAAYWRSVLKPYYCFATAMASVANSNIQVRLQAELATLAGQDDADALLSNLGGKEYLASLGPVVNIARVARGEMTREAYLEQFGHRSPYEFELSRPQPVDDPAWLDRQLEEYKRAPVDVDALLARQRTRFDAAWRNLSGRHPGPAKRIRRKLEEASRLTKLREAARSELTRVMGVVRAFALRAGELAGLREEVFQLTVEELLAVLEGDESAVRFLPARRKTYERYRSLPPYPPVISGRFDPLHWAADPARRADVFDSHAILPPPQAGLLRGFAGAAGSVEGLVRRIDHIEDSRLLQPGEILVTTTTNVGWTPLFPRAAAIVTDVGAPLSHAAIVARELGIPAVVGCNDATMRLRTGDRVRVDGGKGTVEILEAAGALPNKRR